MYGGAPEGVAKYNLNFTDNYDWYCKIFMVIPNKSINFRMTKADSDWDLTNFGFD